MGINQGQQAGSSQQGKQNEGNGIIPDKGPESHFLFLLRIVVDVFFQFTRLYGTDSFIQDSQYLFIILSQNTYAVFHTVTAGLGIDSHMLVLVAAQIIRGSVTVAVCIIALSPFNCVKTFLQRIIEPHIRPVIVAFAHAHIHSLYPALQVCHIKPVAGHQHTLCLQIWIA